MLARPAEAETRTWAAPAPVAGTTTRRRRYRLPQWQSLQGRHQSRPFLCPQAVGKKCCRSNGFIPVARVASRAECDVWSVDIVLALGAGDNTLSQKFMAEQRELSEFCHAARRLDSRHKKKWYIPFVQMMMVKKGLVIILAPTAPPAVTTVRFGIETMHKNWKVPQCTLRGFFGWGGGCWDMDDNVLFCHGEGVLARWCALLPLAGA